MNKKNNIVRPIGLRGNEALNRMKELMGGTLIKESVNPSVIEITKKGPDGNIYAIVRENHEYYIKVSEEKTNLVSENFNYIGGLQNKKDKAYPSYAKAIKMLNLKFISINESLAQNTKVNVFINDNLINEHHDSNPEAKLSPNKSFGDNDEYVVDKKGEALDYDAKEDKENSGDNVAPDGKADEYKLTENEEAIDEMINGDEVEEIVETRKGYSISKAMSEMDNIIESVNPTSEIEGILAKLNESEKQALLSVLKKKA